MVVWAHLVGIGCLSPPLSWLVHLPPNTLNPPPPISKALFRAYSPLGSLNKAGCLTLISGGGGWEGLDFSSDRSAPASRVYNVSVIHSQNLTTQIWEFEIWDYRDIWVFPKIVGFPPKKSMD